MHFGASSCLVADSFLFWLLLVSAFRCVVERRAVERFAVSFPVSFLPSSRHIYPLKPIFAPPTAPFVRNFQHSFGVLGYVAAPKGHRVIS